MAKRRKPGPWLNELDLRAGDEGKAREAVARLYEALGLSVPAEVVWVPSPAAGLLAHAALFSEHGGRLFKGDAPAMLQLLMNGRQSLVESWDGDYLPRPEWKSLAVGRRLASRSKVVAEALERWARYLASLPSPGDWPQEERLRAEAVLAQMGAGELVQLAGSFPELKSDSAQDENPAFARSFHFNYRVAHHSAEGSTFELRAPTCLHFDQLAEHLYAIENLTRAPLPDWWTALSDLAVSAGWLWPFDRVAVLCAPACESHYDDRGYLHHHKQPATVFSDGWKVWAIYGDVASGKAVASSGEIRPQDVLAETDQAQRRLLIKRRGPELLQEPGWPEELRRTARMVFELQYRAFTPQDLPKKAKAWPDNVPEPNPEQASFEPDVSTLRGGLYYSLNPDGSLRLVARVKRKDLDHWMYLRPGVAECFSRSGPVAWHYYPDGRTEFYSPWDDGSSPGFTDVTFEEWARETLESI